MNAKHTPGPWKWHTNGTITDNNSTKIAYTYLEDGNANNNTRLIAAAPDMLAALETLAVWARKGSDLPGTLEEMIIRNISRAKGE